MLLIHRIAWLIETNLILKIEKERINFLVIAVKVKFQTARNTITELTISLSSGRQQLYEWSWNNFILFWVRGRRIWCHLNFWRLLNTPVRTKLHSQPEWDSDSIAEVWAGFLPSNQRQQDCWSNCRTTSVADWSNTRKGWMSNGYVWLPARTRKLIN